MLDIIIYIELAIITILLGFIVYMELDMCGLFEKKHDGYKVMTHQHESLDCDRPLDINGK